MSRYTKTIVAAITTVAVFIQALYSDPGFQKVVADSNVTQDEAIKLVFLVLGTLGVYGFKNVPPVGQAPDPNISEATR